MDVLGAEKDVVADLERRVGASLVVVVGLRLLSLEDRVLSSKLQGRMFLLEFFDRCDVPGVGPGKSMWCGRDGNRDRVRTESSPWRRVPNCCN